jgi:hypothetical protein
MLIFRLTTSKPEKMHLEIYRKAAKRSKCSSRIVNMKLPTNLTGFGSLSNDHEYVAYFIIACIYHSKAIKYLSVYHKKK